MGNKPVRILVGDTEIKILRVGEEDYICLTDMVGNYGGDQVIYSWMRNRNTVEFLGIWETLNNPDFKGIEFDTFRKQAGLNSFFLTPKKWIDATGAIGIFSRAGRYNGGTFAHRDIAFEFGSYLSPEFKLMIIKEFQRLKQLEQTTAEWDYRRFLTKVNYRLHTDAVKAVLVSLSGADSSQSALVYASEADVINLALFGMTARQWRQTNKNKKGNIRDYATIEQLTVLANLESIHSMLINDGMSKQDRFVRLRQEAQRQMSALISSRLRITPMESRGDSEDHYLS